MKTQEETIKQKQDRQYEEVRQESRKAFDKAISDKRLSNDPNADNYAGGYMYMGNHEGKDHFKNIITRDYIL